jgi:hypothetical protein
MPIRRLGLQRKAARRAKIQAVNRSISFKGFSMNSIIYIVGLVVVVLFVARMLGLH